MTSLLSRHHVQNNVSGTYTCQDLNNPSNRDRVEIRIVENNMQKGEIIYENTVICYGNLDILFRYIIRVYYGKL